VAIIVTADAVTFVLGSPALNVSTVSWPFDAYVFLDAADDFACRDFFWSLRKGPAQKKNKKQLVARFHEASKP